MQAVAGMIGHRASEARHLIATSWGYEAERAAFAWTSKQSGLIELELQIGKEQIARYPGRPLSAIAPGRFTAAYPAWLLILV